MRLNRGTIILLLASVVIIVAVLVVNNNPAPEPEAETVVNEDGGPLLPDLAEEDVVSLAVSENDLDSGGFSRVSRDPDDDSLWVVTTLLDTADRVVDQTAAAQAIADALALEADSSFEVESLAEFGLDAPTYLIEIDTGGDALDVVFVGNENPNGTRYYVMTRSLEVSADSEDAATGPDLAEGSVVSLVNTTAIEKLTDLIADPPFEPLPTATVTPTATLNPMSEVEMATATAEAGATATAEMESVMATIAAQPEATAEATAEATEEPD